MSMRDKLRWAAIAAAGLLLLLFVCFNLEKVDVNIIVASVRMRIAFVILFSAGLGAGATAAWFVMKARSRPKS
jgi:uncharacterized integral membrane protein